MKIYVYMVYDKIAKVHSVQCLKETPEQVEESHRRQVNYLAVKEPEKLETMKDHSLHLVGSYDDNNGKITLQDSELVVDFDNLILNCEVLSDVKN